jgi:type IV secretory pathway VirB10-like protein
MQELVVEWARDVEEAEKNVQEAKQNVEHVEELRTKIAAGTATPDDMVEAADLLRRGVSPDDDDVLDAPCDSEDESSEEEEGKAKVGMKRKQAAKKTERKRAERKTEAGTEKRQRGRKAKVVDEPPPEWKIANGECE